MSENKTDHMRDHLQQLVNSTIMSVEDDGGRDTRDRLYGLRIRKADGTEVIAWILRDPEGNGPGHLDVEEVS